MSYPTLTPEVANECSRAAHQYHPDCYCAIHWVYADYPPRQMYHELPTKWLEAYVWRCTSADQPDRFVAAAVGNSGPEMLRSLQTVMAAVVSGERPDPSLLAADHHQKLISSYLAHPLLPAAALHKAVTALLPRLPVHEARALQNELGWALSERIDQAHHPPEGGGWIASVPQTTQELKPWPT